MSAAGSRTRAKVRESRGRLATGISAYGRYALSAGTPDEQAPPHVVAAPCDGILEALCDAASAARQITGHTAASIPTNRTMTRATTRLMRRNIR